MRLLVTALAVASTLAIADRAAAEPILGPARAVASDSLAAPRFDAAGERLLATGVGGRGLVWVELSSGDVHRVLADTHRVAEARFAGPQRLLVADRAGAARVVVDLAGAPQGSAPPVSGPAAVVDDQLYVTHEDGTVARVGAGDRFFGPVVSPDGRRVVVQGLATGLHVYDLARRQLVHVGPGTAPSWSPDGQRLVYERTEDDGHVIVGSDLFLFEVGADRARRLTRTPQRVERRPSFSADGRRLAFDDDAGTLYVAELAEVAR